MVRRGLVWLRSVLIRHVARRSGPRRSRGRDGDELGEVEIALAPAEAERAVQAGLDGQRASEHGSVGVSRLDLKTASLVANGEVAGDHALLGVREEAVQIELRRELAVRVDVACRSHGEARLPPREEAVFEKAVRPGERVDAGHAQLLEQPILERFEEALDTALCLWC